MSRKVKLGGRLYDLVPCARCEKPMQKIPGSPFDCCFTCTAGPQKEGESDRDYRERAIRTCAAYAEQVPRRPTLRVLPGRAVESERKTARERAARGWETVHPREEYL